MCGQTEYLKSLHYEEFDSILCNFYSATGLKAKLIDVNGNSIGFSSIKTCDFCELIQKCENGTEKCKGTYDRAAKHADMFGQPYIFRCHAGLVVFAIPINSNGKLMGAIICGPMLMWKPESFFWEEIMDMTRGLKADANSLKAAALKLEIISGEKVQASANLLHVIINQLIQYKVIIDEQKKKMSQIQSHINNNIRERKQVSDKTDEGLSRLLNEHQLERELIEKIKLGKREEAGKLFTSVLSLLMGLYAYKPEVIKTRVIEFALKLSRSVAISTSINDKLAAMNSIYLQEVFGIDDSVKLCEWLKRVFDSCMDIYIKENSSVKHNFIIKNATDFIKKNYGKELTINEIARSVSISPYYLCHIFKEVMNTTITQYITEVRIEKAKEFLHNYNFSVEDVARKTGYKQVGYFIKRFKKVQGLTPIQYRNSIN